MDRTKKEALKRARRLRDEFDEGGKFHVSEYTERLKEELKDLEDECYESFVDGIAKSVDEEYTHEKNGYSDPLFPGWDMAGEYADGKGYRVSKKNAQMKDIDTAVAIAMRNASAINAAVAKMLEEATRIRPYMEAGMTKRQAIEAYMADNPGDSAA